MVEKFLQNCRKPPKKKNCILKLRPLPNKIFKKIFLLVIVPFVVRR